MAPDTPAHIRDLPRLTDADFLYEGYSGARVSDIHDAATKLFHELDAMAATTHTRYFVLGSYDSFEDRRGPKDRLEAVRDTINQHPHPASAFLLGELDEANEHWSNFYLKFRYALIGTDYVLLAAEDNDGGHELELGRVPLADTYVLKRDYAEVSIERDVEYEKFDAMMGTLFDVMAENDRLERWTTEHQLLERIEDVVAETA
ncbi:hypothetical protein B4589_000345 [Halolamina sp. CBA1230]|uniref:hypothetical protein n=1 Tax=Halolamina sp. CBA1230 TaxID=1853690 RepID=UPI0009A206EA|nr:hypothetical protein [Halolamina sp. CBA1230]QKY18892.1 hypothetical protein B4589_000345 [Halolamina sp. CBA1230]